MPNFFDSWLCKLYIKFLRAQKMVIFKAFKEPENPKKSSEKAAKILRTKTQKFSKEEFARQFIRHLFKFLPAIVTIYIIYALIVGPFLFIIEDIYELLMGHYSLQYFAVAKLPRIALTLGLFTLIVYVFIYRIIWRRIFKDFRIMRRGGVEALQGRCYFVTNEGLVGKFAAWVLNEKDRIAYVNRGRFLNLLMPWRSITKIHIPEYVILEWRTFEVVARDNKREGLYIVFDGYEKEYYLVDEERRSDHILPQYQNIELQKKISTMILPVTRKSSFVDPSLRKRQLEASFIILPESVFESVMKIENVYAVMEILHDLATKFVDTYQSRLDNGENREKIAQDLSPLAIEIVRLAEEARTSGVDDMPNIRDYLGEDYNYTKNVSIAQIFSYVNEVLVTVKKYVGERE